MLDLTITETNTTQEPIVQKHFKECFWKDKHGNISFAECPWCQIFKTIPK